MTPTLDSRPDTYAHQANVRGLLLGVARDLTHRAHVHDDSKLCEPELACFDEFTEKLAGTTYGSPEYKAHLEEMQVGLRHHYEANDHHPEHYGEVEEIAGRLQGGIHDMNLLQLTELLCDWIAATRRHDDGDIRRSIDQNAERFGYGEELRRLLHNTVDAILAAELA